MFLRGSFKISVKSGKWKFMQLLKVSTLNKYCAALKMYSSPLLPHVHSRKQLLLHFLLNPISLVLSTAVGSHFVIANLKHYEVFPLSGDALRHQVQNFRPSFVLRFTPSTLKCHHYWIHILEMICLLSSGPFSCGCAKFYRDLRLLPIQNFCCVRGEV